MNFYSHIPLPSSTLSSGQTPVVREYISSDTWTKPEGLDRIMVVAVGAGGGGGAGKTRATGLARPGGGAGGGGAHSFRIIPASGITGSTYTVTVGVGGNGGPPTNSTQNGGSGIVGGDTELTNGSALVLAKGGARGTGGTTQATPTNGGIGGSAVDSFPEKGAFILDGGNGGDGRTNVSGISGQVGYAGKGGAGGGGGCGANAAGTSGNGGGGGGSWDDGVFTAGPLGGVIGDVEGKNGVDDLCPNLFSDIFLLTYSPGTGGSGGRIGAAPSGPSGSGGNGGRCAGGGGGAGSFDGEPAGSGGNGGDGYMVIVEFY